MFFVQASVFFGVGRVAVYVQAQELMNNRKGERSKKSDGHTNEVKNDRINSLWSSPLTIKSSEHFGINIYSGSGRATRNTVKKLYSRSVQGSYIKSECV